MKISAYPFIASPNFSGRRGMDVEGTVIHYTAGGQAIKTINHWFALAQAKAAAHFVDGRRGDVYQCVELTKSAWHAGTSEMIYKGEMTSNANRFTIGIELSNRGLLHRGKDGKFYYASGENLKLYKGPQPVHASLLFDSGHEVRGWWEPWPDEQIFALKELLERIGNAGYEKAASNLIGHEEIKMPLGGKIDPGPLFPWEEFGRPANRRTKGIIL